MMQNGTRSPDEAASSAGDNGTTPNGRPQRQIKRPIKLEDTDSPLPSSHHRLRNHQAPKSSSNTKEYSDSLFTPTHNHNVKQEPLHKVPLLKLPRQEMKLEKLKINKSENNEHQIENYESGAEEKREIKISIKRSGSQHIITFNNHHHQLRPSTSIPTSADDLLIKNSRLLMHAVSIYEILRHFGPIIRLSPFRFEDFCCALLIDEQSQLLSEIHLQLLRACLREDKQQQTWYGPQDLRDSINLYLHLGDSLTWPAALRIYLTAAASSNPPSLENIDDEDDENLDLKNATLSAANSNDILQLLLGNPNYPFDVDLETRLQVLQYLCDQFMLTTPVRDDVVNDQGPKHDDHCRSCHKNGNLIYCRSCSAAYHEKCMSSDPVTTSLNSSTPTSTTNSNSNANTNLANYSTTSNGRKKFKANPEDEEDDEMTDEEDDDKYWECTICINQQVQGVTDCLNPVEREGFLRRHEPIGVDRFGRRYWLLCRRVFVTDDDDETDVRYYSTREQFDNLMLALGCPTGQTTHSYNTRRGGRDSANSLASHDEQTSRANSRTDSEFDDESCDSMATTSYKRRNILSVDDDEARLRENLLDMQHEIKRQMKITEDLMEKYSAEYQNRDQVLTLTPGGEISRVSRKELVIASLASKNSNSSSKNPAPILAKSASNNMTGDATNAVSKISTPSSAANVVSTVAKNTTLSIENGVDKITSSVSKIPAKCITSATCTSTSSLDDSITPEIELANVTTPEKSPLKVIGPDTKVEIQGQDANSQIKDASQEMKNKLQIQLQEKNVNKKHEDEDIEMKDQSDLDQNVKVDAEYKPLGMREQSQDQDAKIKNSDEKGTIHEQNVKKEIKVEQQVEVKKDTDEVEKREISILPFKLGLEGNYRSYRNYYTTHQLALNKYQHAENEFVKNRALANKFCLSAQTEFRWNGQVIGNLNTVIATLRTTLVKLESSLPHVFMHPAWPLHRANWIKGVNVCTKAQDFALAMSILESCIKPVLFKASWYECLGFTNRLHRTTLLEREEAKRTERVPRGFERREYVSDDFEMSKRLGTVVKFPVGSRKIRPIKHQVWKQKGEEYRITGLNGWYWRSATQARAHLRRGPPRPRPQLKLPKSPLDISQLRVDIASPAIASDGISKPSSVNKNRAKLPPCHDFMTKSTMTRSLLVMPSSDLRRLARAGGLREARGFSSLAKPTTPSIWSYGITPRPVLRTCWLYRNRLLSSIHDICLQLRVFWSCLRWDDLQQRPPPSGVNVIITDNETITIELLRRRDLLPYFLRSEYLIKKTVVPIEQPTKYKKRANYGTPSGRSGLRKRPEGDETDTGPTCTEIWVNEEQLELWEIRQFGEKMERAAQLAREKAVREEAERRRKAEEEAARKKRSAAATQAAQRRAANAAAARLSNPAATASATPTTTKGMTVIPSVRLGNTTPTLLKTAHKAPIIMANRQTPPTVKAATPVPSNGPRTPLVVNQNRVSTPVRAAVPLRMSTPATASLRPGTTQLRVSAPVRVTAPNSTIVRVTTPPATPVRMTAPATTPVRMTAPATTPVRVTAPATTPVRVTAPATTPVRMTAPATTQVRMTAPATTPVRVPIPVPSPQAMQNMSPIALAQSAAGIPFTPIVLSSSVPPPPPIPQQKIDPLLAAPSPALAQTPETTSNTLVIPKPAALTAPNSTPVTTAQQNVVAASPVAGEANPQSSSATANQGNHTTTTTYATQVTTEPSPDGYATFKTDIGHIIRLPQSYLQRGTIIVRHVGAHSSTNYIIRPTVPPTSATLHKRDDNVKDH